MRVVKSWPWPRAPARAAPFFDFRALLDTPRTRGTKPGYHFVLEYQHHCEDFAWAVGFKV